MGNESIVENMVELLENFYKNKKVLITGHTGFKGSWLTLLLKKLGADITGIALPPKTLKDNYVVSNLDKYIENYISDVRDFDSLSKLILNIKPEIIFHLAAQSLVFEGFNNPYETFDINFRGTLNVLECFRKIQSIKILIAVTTDKVYENKEWLWSYRENDRLGGKDPYSASKASCELLIHSYHQSFFKGTDKFLASVRAGNVIGGGDWSENRIVPDFFRALESNSTLEIRNPNSIRPWQFVLEPLFGYILLGAKISGMNSNDFYTFNFGPDKGNFVDVLTLVRELSELNQGINYNINKERSTNLESNFLFLDSIKAFKLLGWKSKLGFKKSLELTSEWYEQYKAGLAYDVCNRQIDFYLSLWKSKN